MSKRQFTLTGTYFNEKRPDREVSLDSPVEDPPPFRKPILRLSWEFPQPKLHLKSLDVAKTIETSSLGNTTFFPDTCFLTAPMAESVWRALLTRRVHISPWVLTELQPFLQTPHCNHFVRDDLLTFQADGKGPVKFLDENECRSVPGHEYYVQLLALRKLKGIQFGSEFCERISREPTKAEFFSQYKQIYRGFDDRAFRMAWKGWVDRRKSNYLTDERTVVTAVLHALTSGCETVILSRDHDLSEQFYKVVYLIDTHYRSFLFAEYFVENDPDWFVQELQEVKPDPFREYLETRFDPDGGKVVSPELPEPDTWNMFLPEQYHAVMAECWWFGDGPEDVQLCRMPFCAETEMNKVCIVKSLGKGRNSQRFADANCHIWPCPGWELTRPMVVIAKDRVANVLDTEMRTTDMLHAVASNEAFSKILIDDPNSRP